MGSKQPTGAMHAGLNRSPLGSGGIAIELGPAAAGRSGVWGWAEARAGRSRIAAILLLAVLILLIVGPLSRLGSDSHRAPVARPASPQGLASLPLAAQAPVSAAIGAARPGYAARVEDGKLVAANPDQHLRARFDRSGAEIRAGKARVGLLLAGLGVGSSLTPLAGVSPSADANRVVYRYRGVSESFVNGPLGVDQRFTIAHAPAGSGGPLTLSLALSGTLKARVSAGGKALVLAGANRRLNYRGLAATDARGRPLHAWLSLRGGHLLVRVDTRGARYPVLIDPLIQQGPVLTDLPGGEGLVGSGLFGSTVALSSDGNTVLVGVPREYKEIGAAFVFVRSGSTWSQQAELIGDCTSNCAHQGTGEIGHAEFGGSVALSADGNTAAIGALDDDAFKGAVWVFTRSGSSWTQQTKLVADCTSECANQGTGEGSFGGLGSGVALASDGNTLIAGAPFNESEGAAWVFTRSGSSWSEQAKLVADCTGECPHQGTGESESGRFGQAVALSGDGNTALIGASEDTGAAGAAWIFDRSVSTWTAQPKLVGDCTSECANEGTGEIGQGFFGSQVTLSTDGTTALIGGEVDDNLKGAVWVFTDSGATWSEQTKLVADCTSECAHQGTGEAGNGQFGHSTALSGDGNTAVIGANGDDSAIGAAWVFRRAGSSWTQDGSKVVGDCSEECEYQGTGETGEGQFGSGVAISSDGSTVMIGARTSDANDGGVWPFIPASTATVSTGPSSEVSQSGCSFTIEGEHARVSAEALTACLGNNATATLTTEVPNTSINIASPVTGSESSSLELISTGSVSQSAPISTGELDVIAATGITLKNAENSVSKLEVENTESGNAEFVNEAPLQLGKVQLQANMDAKIKAEQIEQELATKIEGRKLDVIAQKGIELKNEENSVSSLEMENTESGNAEFVNEAPLQLGKVQLQANMDAKIKAEQIEQELATKIEGRKLDVIAQKGIELKNEENSVSSLEMENTESGNAEFANERVLTLGKISTPAHTETVIKGKELAQEKSATLAAGKLALSAAEGIKLTGTANAAERLEAIATASGNVEYTNKTSMGLDAVSAPGKGKVSVELTNPQAEATATGPISGGKVALDADRMSLAGGLLTSKSVSLAPVSTSQPINLGSSQPSTLSLLQADMAAVNAKKLLVGATNAGQITVSAAITPPAVVSLTLETAQQIQGAIGGSLSVPTLALIDPEPAPAVTWTITPSTVAQGAGEPVPYVGVANLAVSGGGTFNVKASPGTKESLAGAKKSSNAIVDYDAEGRTVSGSPSPPKGVIQSPGVKPVHYKQVGAVNIANRG